MSSISTDLDTDFLTLTEEAQKAASAGLWAAAEKFYRAACQIYPDNVQALVGWAQALRRLRKGAEARELLTKATRLDPKNPGLRIEMGKLEASEGEGSRALQIFEGLIQDGVNDPTVRAGKLFCLRQTKREDKYEESIREAETRFPEHPGVLKECALLWRELKRYDQAVKAFLRTNDPGNRDELLSCLSRPVPDTLPLLREAVKQLPNDVEVLRRAGETCVSLKEDHEAARIFGDLLELDPYDLNAIRNRLECLKRALLPSEAKKAAIDILKRLPDDAYTKQQLSDLLWLEGDIDGAVRLTSSPEDLVALVRLSSDKIESVASGVFVAGGRDRKKLLKAGLKRFPRNPKLLLELGRFQVASDDLEQATKTYESFLGDNPRSESAVLELIRLLRRRNMELEADDRARKAHESFPSNTGILNEAAGIALDRMELDRAARLWCSARADGEIAAAVDRLHEAGRFRDAITFTEAVRVLDPKNAGYQFACGAAYSECKEYEKALKAYNIAIEISVRALASLYPGREKNSPEHRLLKRSILTSSGILRMLLDVDGAEQQLKIGFRFLGSRDEDLLAEQAWIAYQRGAYESAEKSFSELCVRSKLNEVAAEGKALCLRRMRQREKALKWIRGHPEVEAWGGLQLLQGDLLLEKGEPRKALSSYRRSHDLGRLEGTVRSAAMLARLKQIDEARELLNDAYQKASPKNKSFVLTHLARLSLAENDRLDAERYAKQIPDYDGPANKATCHGIVHFSSGEYAEAEEFFRKALDAEPYQAFTNCNLAQTLVLQVDSSVRSPGKSGREGRDETYEERTLREAEGLANRTLKIDPSFAPAHACLGVIALRRERLVQADGYFRASIRESYTDGDHGGLGALYLKMGREREAGRELRRACRLDPMDPRPRIELSSLYFQTERKKKGLGILKEAVAIAPHDETAARRLAMAHMEAGELSESIRVLRQAISSLDGERCWQLHLTLGQVFTEMGDKTGDSELYNEAERAIRQAMLYRANSQEVAFYAGVVSYKQKNLAQAKKHFKACERADGSYGLSAAQNLRRIDASEEKGKWGKRASFGGPLLAAFCCLAFIVLWAEFLIFKDKRVEAVMINTLSPILLVLAALGIFLPSLYKVKFSGVEAELTRPKEGLTEALSGSIGFSTGGVISSSLGR